MKIIELQAENVKRLKAVRIRPDGNLVQITGENGSGKSSVLDAIYWALAGTADIQSQPVRRGAQKARIRLDLGDVVVTRRFTEGGNTTVTVEQANGARFPSPQRMLDDLLGALTFDPLAFSRMTPKLQMETLRGLVHLDVDLDALDAENARDYAARTEVNRRAKALLDRVETLHAGVNDTDCTLQDLDALVAELEAAWQQNAAVERWETRRRELAEKRDLLHHEAMGKRQRAEQLLREAEAAEAQAQELARQLAEDSGVPTKVNTTELRQTIDAARRENTVKEAQLRQRAAYRQALHELEDVRAEVKALTDRMAARAQAKADAIAAAQMPVEGLSFGEGGVLYNGLPFEQASSAEQLRASVAIAMAANPKLRVLRIKDGSLLDERSLALIADLADARGYQVWIERVDTSGKVGVVMVDGEVLGAEAAEDAAEPVGVGA